MIAEVDDKSRRKVAVISRFLMVLAAAAADSRLYVRI